MNSGLPLCVIGAGLIGMRHVEVAQRSDRVELTAVVDSDHGRREALVAAGLPVVESIDQVPRRTRAAVLATPTQDHHQGGLDVLDRGWALLVEKPTAGTLDQARALVAAAAAKGLPLVTGHHRRCHPFSQAARSALADLGDLVGIQGMWSLRKPESYFGVDWRRQPGAGPLMTNLTHEIDLLRFFVGGIAEVSALLSSARRGFSIEDTASLAFRFDNGALGSFLISDAGASPWSFEAASSENPQIAASGQDYLRISGTEGALEFPSLTRWTRSAPGEIEWSKPLRRIPGPTLSRIDPLLEQINRFAGLVAGGQDNVLCAGEDGVAALDVTLATALSGKLGRPVGTGQVPGDYCGT